METPIFLGPSSLMCKCPRWAFCYPANQAASSIDALYAKGTVICDAKLKRAPACARRARRTPPRSPWATTGHITRPRIEHLAVTPGDQEAALLPVTGKAARSPQLP